MQVRMWKYVKVIKVSLKFVAKKRKKRVFFSVFFLFLRFLEYRQPRNYQYVSE